MSRSAFFVGLPGSAFPGSPRGLPPGPWITDFAVGEFWSRACRMFAGGERA